MLRRYSNIATAVAVIAWLGSATSAYLGYPTLARALIIVFALGGLFAAVSWLTYCVIITWHWLQGRTRGPSAGA